MLFYSIFSLLLLSYVYSAHIRIDPLVLINQGLVRGLRSTQGDYWEFLGIPYAQVNLDNPFGPALTHPGFDVEIFDAYDGSTRCPQVPEPNERPSHEGETLDCLTLNIFIPTEASSRNPLPVMVWLHGGDFASGSASDYGVRNLVRNGIIIVTVNYRLGPYGFMCLDIPTATGNQGLKDQYAALEWVRSNIASFGGNPYNVTLAGQNSGAASVLHHLYSSKTKIFNKIIAQSGSPQSPSLFTNGDVDAAIRLANHLGLATNNTEEAFAFLSRSPHELVTGAASELDLSFLPCVERSFSGVDNFLDTDPYSLSNARKVRNTPILIGYTGNEALNTLSENFISSDPFYATVQRNFNLEEEQLQQAARIIRQFYIGDSTLSLDLISQLENFQADFDVNHPTERTITNLITENANPLYEYMFNYGDSAYIGKGAELSYLFELNSANQEISEADQLLIDRITTLWSNFVKFGNPTPSVTELLPVTWDPVTASMKPYMLIDSDLQLQFRVNRERMAFWDLFYTMYGQHNKFVRSCDF